MGAKRFLSFLKKKKADGATEISFQLKKGVVIIKDIKKGLGNLDNVEIKNDSLVFKNGFTINDRDVEKTFVSAW